MQETHVSTGGDHTLGQGMRKECERNSKPSFGRADERFLEVPKLVLKDVSRKEWAQIHKYTNVCDLTEVPCARKANVKKQIERLCEAYPSALCLLLLSLDLIKAVRIHLSALQQNRVWSYLYFRKFSLAERKWMNLRGGQQ